MLVEEAGEGSRRSRGEVGGFSRFRGAEGGVGAGRGGVGPSGWGILRGFGGRLKCGGRAGRALLHWLLPPSFPKSRFAPTQNADAVCIRRRAVCVVGRGCAARIRQYAACVAGGAGRLRGPFPAAHGSRLIRMWCGFLCPVVRGLRRLECGAVVSGAAHQPGGGAVCFRRCTARPRHLECGAVYCPAACNLRHREGCAIPCLTGRGLRQTRMWCGLLSGGGPQPAVHFEPVRPFPAAHGSRLIRMWCGFLCPAVRGLRRLESGAVCFRPRTSPDQLVTPCGLCPAAAVVSSGGCAGLCPAACGPSRMWCGGLCPAACGLRLLECGAVCIRQPAACHSLESGAVCVRAAHQPGPTRNAVRSVFRRRAVCGAGGCAACIRQVHGLRRWGGGEIARPVSAAHGSRLIRMWWRSFRWCAVCADSNRVRSVSGQRTSPDQLVTPCGLCPAARGCVVGGLLWFCFRRRTACVTGKGCAIRV